LNEKAMANATTMEACSFVLAKMVDDFPRACRDQAALKDFGRALLRICLIESILEDIAQFVRQAEKSSRKASML
jgi:hypothetical protein